jgi:hypothetical protein
MIRGAAIETNVLSIIRGAKDNTRPDLLTPPPLANPFSVALASVPGGRFAD